MAENGSDGERGGGPEVRLLLLLVLIRILGRRWEAERSGGDLCGVRGGISEEEDGKGEE